MNFHGKLWSTLNSTIYIVRATHYKKMPKNKKSAAKCKETDNKVASTGQDDKGAVYLGKNQEIIIKIHAKPGAKESAITDVSCEAVGVQIGAPPVDGEANKELIRYLAEALQLKKSDFSLEKGSRSKEKTVVISSSAVSLDNIKSQINSLKKQ